MVIENKAKYPEMIIHKSNGVSESEGYLINKCKKTFLSLWSFPNLFTEEKKGKELCDVLAFFENHIFIFSDKYCSFSQETDVHIAWNRWYNKAIEAGAKQILGAEHYIRSRRPIFMDAKLEHPFPFSINVDEKTHIHRIIIARGAKDACQKFFHGGSGSLIIDTSIADVDHICPVSRSGQPEVQLNDPVFNVGLIRDRETYFHVFDDFTLDCIMDELDTVSDFINYLENKEALIRSGKHIFAIGEEELLAKYLSTVENGHHCIAEKKLDKYDAFVFDDDLWTDYVNSQKRKTKKNEDKKSYYWDRLLEKTFSYMMKGESRELSHSDYNQQSILFCRFAKPTRLERRELAEQVLESWTKAKTAVLQKGAKPTFLTRRIIFQQHPDTMLTILWFPYDSNFEYDDYLSVRTEILKAQIRKYIPEVPEIRYHIGMAKTIEEEKESSEDFILIDSEDYRPDSDAIIKAKEMLNGLTSSFEEKQIITVNEYEKTKKHDKTQ